MWNDNEVSVTSLNGQHIVLLEILRLGMFEITLSNLRLVFFLLFGFQKGEARVLLWRRGLYNKCVGEFYAVSTVLSKKEGKVG